MAAPLSHVASLILLGEACREYSKGRREVIFLVDLEEEEEEEEAADRHPS